MFRLTPITPDVTLVCNMQAVKPATSAKLALQGDFMKGHGSLSMSRTTVVSERASLRIDCGMSRIGKKPVTVPKGVTYKIEGQTLTVKVRAFNASPSNQHLISGANSHILITRPSRFKVFPKAELVSLRCNRARSAS